jgi:fumarate reductase subunit C
MQPSRPGRTRTADPRPPDQFPARGRYRSYILFGSCGALLMISSLLVLRAVRALGEGEAAWNGLLADFGHPLYLAYHVVALVGIVWFTLRFFRLFPKTQPARIGPAPRPPDAFFAVALNGAFVVVSAALVAILWGVVP